MFISVWECKPAIISHLLYKDDNEDHDVLSGQEGAVVRTSIASSDSLIMFTQHCNDIKVLMDDHCCSLQPHSSND